jgi:hypothetical protein
VEPNLGAYHVRKWYLHDEEVLANETGQHADGTPLRRLVIAAAIHNPYAGTFSEDLSRIVEGSDALGKEFGRRIVAASAATSPRATARPASSAATGSTSTATRS